MGYYKVILTTEDYTEVLRVWPTAYHLSCASQKSMSFDCCLVSVVLDSIKQPSAYVCREALGTLVEPYLSLFRRFIPTFSGMDFSPIVALIVLQLVERLIWNILV